MEQVPGWGGTIRILVNNLDINQVLLSNKSNTPITPSQPAVTVFTVTTVAALAAKTEFLEVFFRDDAQTQDLALRTIYVVEDECENPIMISWVNSLGATEQFLFSFNQEIEDVANVGTVTVPPIIDDIANEDIGIARTNVTTRQFITLFADHLNNEEIRALHELKHAEKVEVWLDKAGSLRAIDVVVEDIYSTSYTTRSPLNLFTVKIRFPDDFDFFEAKTY